MRRSHAILAATMGLAFLVLQWLRWPEPPGLDQSLFVTYGHWLGRGLTLYRDLWDSKPPGLFALYAIAERSAGVQHTPRVLDALAALATGVLTFVLLRVGRSAAASRGERVLPWIGAWLAAISWSAPPFGGPIVAAQAEVLMAPFVLGAVWASRRDGARAGLLSGLLLGSAISLKLVALVLLPLAWLFATAAARRDLRRTAAILAGIVIPLAICAAVLAAQGVLGDAVQAVLVYPRAYSAEFAARLPLGTALGRGFERFRRGLPLVLVLAVSGVALSPRGRWVRPSVAWLALAVVGITSQRQMTSYHLVLALPPLVLLTAIGTARLVDSVPRYWRHGRSGHAWVFACLALLGITLTLAAGRELRLWSRHYAPHIALRDGTISSSAEFWTRLGGPGPAWREAVDLGSQLNGGIASAGRSPERILVWGLAPAVYAVSGCRPATRYCLHQTLLVEDSPLSRRWPDARVRRTELMQSLHADPPRWVVLVSGDRSGLEPQDSLAELEAFPELSGWLDAHYHARASTAAYRLLEHSGAVPDPVDSPSSSR